jgi:acyl CoA:acetate/3-ketoacid CoA transferase alpha subunit
MFFLKKRTINGRDYILEDSITGDYSLIKAWKSDKKGNLIFKNTARNFNPNMATASKITIVEVEEIIENGEIDPNNVHLPGIYVHRIFKGQNFQKRIEVKKYNIIFL